jgi:hypothetical protein
MKIIYFSFLILLLSSCKKDKQCYTCQVTGTTNGVNYDYRVEYCEPDPQPLETDPNGNVLNMSCTPK